MWVGCMLACVSTSHSVCVCGGVYLKTICRSWFSSAVWLPGAGLRSSGSRTNTFTDSATSLAHHCHFDSAFYTDFRLVYLLTSLKGYTEELHQCLNISNRKLCEVSSKVEIFSFTFLISHHFRILDLCNDDLYSWDYFVSSKYFQLYPII